MKISPYWLLITCVVMLFGMVLIACAETEDVKTLVDIIYIIEGGSKTKYPYGIRSVHCEGEKECRKICVNTVENNLRRFERSEAKATDEDFVDFLAVRYCPPQADAQGHINWKRNVKYFLRKWKDETHRIRN